MRARDDVLDAYAERVGAELREVEEIRQEWVEDGVELLDSRERRRVVDHLRDRYPERWQSLSRAVGDEALAERAAVASSVLAAILERQPPARELFELIEVMPPPASPCGVLMLLIDPHLVWERDDAVVLGRLVRHTGDAQRFYKEIHQLADSRVDEWHVTRVRELAARISGQVPPNLERACALLEAALEEAERDEDAARWVAGSLLAPYAELVALGKIESR